MWHKPTKGCLSLVETFHTSLNLIKHLFCEDRFIYFDCFVCLLTCGLSASMRHTLLIKRAHNKCRLSFWPGISQSPKCNSNWEFVCCCCLRCCSLSCWDRLRRRFGVATTSMFRKPSIRNPGPICTHPYLAVREDVVARTINTATTVASCRKSTVRRDGE